MKRRKVEIALEYHEGRSDPRQGRFEGGVKAPEFVSELGLWVNPRERFDSNEDKLVPEAGYQVQLTGTRRALFELGRYLVALSEYETEDPDYHSHFDVEDLAPIAGQPPCELIVRGPRPLEVMD